MFHSPFDQLGPDSLGRAAAEQLKPSLPTLSEGKMFGVLVAEDARGERVVLKAFSGMLDGKWDHPGFAAPVFDCRRRAECEPRGEASVKRLHALFEEQLQIVERWEREKLAQKEQHSERRAQRNLLRQDGEDLELDQQSRRDKAERRVLKENVRRAQRRLASIKRLRQLVSRAVMTQIHDTYVVSNFRGESKPLRVLYAPRPSAIAQPTLDATVSNEGLRESATTLGPAPEELATPFFSLVGNPPSGAADCAAPKLLAEAYRLKLKPVALAELWWGPPPPGGGRVHGAYYPACKEKCGPLLPFMLEGLDVAAPRRFVIPVRRIELSILHEDPSFLVVEKPVGILSIPGKEQPYSVLEELQIRFPNALMVHRLDLDTSGLLLVALDARSHANLQAQFARRSVHKRYVAWLEGEVAYDRGEIDLPLRVDLEDRPRQIYDPIHGKRALTAWEVLERRDGRTRVVLFPHTGRTHQLRVHAAHPRGIGVPIVGDRLYGRAGERLLLHAETLAFEHPVIQEPMRFTLPAPF